MSLLCFHQGELIARFSEESSLIHQTVKHLDRVTLRFPDGQWMVWIKDLERWMSCDVSSEMKLKALLLL